MGNGYNLALVVTAVKGIVEAFDATKTTVSSSAPPSSAAPAPSTEGKHAAPQANQAQPAEVRYATNKSGYN